MLCLLLVVTACALPGNVVVLVPDEGGTVGKVVVAKDGSRQELAGSYDAINSATPAQTEGVFQADIRAVEAVFAGALAAKPRPPAVYLIFFVIGQTEVDPGSTDTLAHAVTTALTTPHADISVVGHSDAVGSDTVNMDLSLRRAQTISDALIVAGVPASKIEIGSYGSNNPLIPTARGAPEARNRRVEVTIR